MGDSACVEKQSKLSEVDSHRIPQQALPLRYRATRQRSHRRSLSRSDNGRRELRQTFGVTLYRTLAPEAHRQLQFLSYATMHSPSRFVFQGSQHLQQLEFSPRRAQCTIWQSRRTDNSQPFSRKPLTLRLKWLNDNTSTGGRRVGGYPQYRCISATEWREGVVVARCSCVPDDPTL